PSAAPPRFTSSRPNRCASCRLRIMSAPARRVALKMRLLHPFLRAEKCGRVGRRPDSVAGGVGLGPACGAAPLSLARAPLRGPLVSLYLLWSRRDLLAAAESRPSWWGLPLLAAGLALRFAGTYLYFDWLGLAALFPSLMGLALLAGGLPALRWSWPAVLFLA